MVRARAPKPITELRTVIVGWEIRCAHCGDLARVKRKDARYCSKACRNAANYQRTRGVKDTR